MRGANLAVLEHFDEALECHEHAVQFEEDNKDEAYLNLGAVLRAQRKYREAAEAFKRALVALSPEYELGRVALRSLSEVELAIEMAAAIPEH